jgi:hypothetical protein
VAPFAIFRYLIFKIQADLETEACQLKTCHRTMFQQSEASDVGREMVDTLMVLESGC